jgi:hypothetical protein
MLTELTDKLIANEQAIKARLAQDSGWCYESLVSLACEIAFADDEYGVPDPKRITVINHGDYQGTLHFCIGAKGYQPSTLYVTSVEYGSCSGCDAIQSVNDLDDRAEQVREWWSLTLHMFQRMQEV